MSNSFVHQVMREKQMLTADKVKQSLYFPEEMLIEIREEARRLDRSLSWIVQRAWKVAHKQLQAMPSSPTIDEENDEPEI